MQLVAINKIQISDPPSRPELIQLSVSDSGTGIYRCNVNSLGYPANAQLAFEMTNTQDVQVIFQLISFSVLEHSIFFAAGHFTTHCTIT